MLIVILTIIEFNTIYYKGLKCCTCSDKICYMKLAVHCFV